MYRINQQITLTEFIFPYGKLDPTNRWVKIADMIPWEKYEKRYAEQFCEDNGAPAVPFRMAMGTLIIKQRTGHSDDETLQNIMENPYLQYLIGLHEFTQETPFSLRSITNFRKYIPQEMINDLNEELFRPKSKNNNEDDNNSSSPPSSDNSKPQPSDKAISPTIPSNQGEILIDATCTPANIAYPTDINLLNEAREKLEEIIDVLHSHTSDKIKPRTDRTEARRKFLHFIRQRKPRKKSIRKAIRQQLRYVRRNLSHIDNQLTQTTTDPLSHRQIQWLETIRILYTQQDEKYRTGNASIPDRIVSISQPHVRPIVRGKARTDVEFGAKVNASMIEGYAFIDKLDWNAYSEADQLIPAAEEYKQKTGCYPVAIIADKLFRNRKNLAYCKEHGIRLSGPRLGRPPKLTDKSLKELERQDASARNAIEGKFGEGKTKYGLDRIMARLQETSETVISLAFLCMNISRRLRLLFAFFWPARFCDKFPVDNSGLETPLGLFGVFA